MGLLKTFDDVVAEVDAHAVVGTGAPLAEYIIERLWMPDLSAAVTMHIARQLFREARQKGPYVGGNTEIISCRVTDDAELFFELEQDKNGVEYRFLWGIDELTTSAVRVALDHSLSVRMPSHVNLKFVA
jgi:hypothetical protein